MREKQLNIRLSDEEAACLERISVYYRGIGGAAVVRLLLKNESARIEQELRKEQANRRYYWQLEKAQISKLVRISRVPNLTVAIDDEKRTFTLSDGKLTQVATESTEAGMMIQGWPGSRLVGWTSENEPVVAKTNAALERAARVREPLSREQWKKLGCSVDDLT